MLKDNNDKTTASEYKETMYFEACIDHHTQIAHFPAVVDASSNTDLLNPFQTNMIL